jgi:hypothetical protein
MTTIELPRTTSASRRSDHATSRRRSDQLVYDGVVAAYIHDISRGNGRPRRISDPTRRALARHRRGEAT